MDTAADALLVIDVQRAFVAGPTAVPSADTLASAVGRLLAVARDAGALVVHLQNDGHVGAADEPGTDGWKLLFPPAAGELVIRKSDDDAFVGTGLESALLDNGVKTVALCGVQSEMCVAATARGAMRRGLSIVLPRDAHGTYPVPADAGGIAVPASHVRRVAEWSLGDEILAPPSASDVAFTRVAQ
jgi:nicotinamidase-related amidase